MRKVHGFNDSKQVTEEDREKMFKEIKEIDKTQLGYMVSIGSPEHISNV